jgi:hypothetical protein
MTDTTPAQVAPSPTAATAPRIVLFGRTAAGKTSLLGALAEAAIAQQDLLHGRLIDPSHHLDDLRSTLYAGGPSPTDTEVVAYPVDFEPFSEGRASTPRHFPVVLIDCDGNAAHALLEPPEQHKVAPAEGALVRQLAEADTLVLAIDAASSPEQMEAAFEELHFFLQELEQKRGNAAEVGGLPVFLVLTKCDLLVQPGDMFADWLEHIEARKRDIDGRFRAFLDRQQPEVGRAFGRIDLHVWATAIQRPQFARTAASHEPFGVAELFRQCLEEAAEFRQLRGRSQNRLRWTVGGAAAVATVLGVLIVGGVIDNLTTTDLPLHREIASLRASEPLPGSRLVGDVSDLQNRLSELDRIHEDPTFAELPRDDKKWVGDRIEELRRYLAYFKELRGEPRPVSRDTLPKLQEMEERLNTKLALPDPDWAASGAGEMHRELLADIKALREGVVRMQQWYQDSSSRLTDLREFRGYGSGAGSRQKWTNEAVAALAVTVPPTLEDKLKLPGSATSLTYAATHHFRAVKDARKEWEADHSRLQHLLEVLSALGLAPPATDRPALLVFPPTPTMALVRERSQQWQQAHPVSEKDIALDSIPAAVREAVKDAARTNYEYLLEPGRAEVLRQLQRGGTGADETPARWQAVREWLSKPEELADWRILARVLLRLSDPAAPDPVPALQEFLNRPEIPLAFRRVYLDIPQELVKRITPGSNARFELFHSSEPDASPAIALPLTEEGEYKDMGETWHRCTFSLAKEDQITFRPGDAFRASLRLRGDQVLTWASQRSTLYRMECLRRPPRLHRTGESSSEGTPQEGLRLSFDPEDGVPRVPDLVPHVRLEPR